MRKLTSILTLALCACNSEAPITETINSDNIVDRIEVNGKNLLIAKNKEDFTVIEISGEQFESLKTLNTFEVEYTRQHNQTSGKAINIKSTIGDTTNKRELLEANDEAIEDFKRKKNGSYTILERPNRDGFIVVNTPSQEISKMIRTEAYKFFYYKNWDGRYYFDHIEDNPDTTSTHSNNIE